MCSRRESLLSVHPAWSYRYRWGTARASTAAWGLLCRWGIVGAVYPIGDPYRVSRCRWGEVEAVYPVGDPYRVSRPILYDWAPRQAAPGDSELLRFYPGKDMKW